MTGRLVHDQQLARLLDRAAQLQEQAARHDEGGAAGEDAPPAGSHQFADIQAAAAEAGIAEEFVALAALELAATGTTGAGTLTPVQRRRALRWLGAREPGIRQALRLRAPLDRLLTAIGTTLQMPQYGLRITDSTRDLRRGGTMLLKIPEFVSAATGTILWFAYYLRGALDIEHLRLTIEPHGEQDHEVALAVDLEQAWPGMSAWARGLSPVLGALAAWLAWALAGSFAAPFVLALPLSAIAGACAAWLGLYLIRWRYEHCVARAVEKLRMLLGDIDGAVRSQAVFGVLPPVAPLPGPQTDMDASSASIIVG